jgi:hypothetical protein
VELEEARENGLSVELHPARAGLCGTAAAEGDPASAGLCGTAAAEGDRNGQSSNPAGGDCDRHADAKANGTSPDHVGDRLEAASMGTGTSDGTSSGGPSAQGPSKALCAAAAPAGLADTSAPTGKAPLKRPGSDATAETALRLEPLVEAIAFSTHRLIRSQVCTRHGYGLRDAESCHGMALVCFRGKTLIALCVMGPPAADPVLPRSTRVQGKGYC